MPSGVRHLALANCCMAGIVSVSVSTKKQQNQDTFSCQSPGHPPGQPRFSNGPLTVVEGAPFPQGRALNSCALETDHGMVRLLHCRTKRISGTLPAPSPDALDRVCRVCSGTKFSFFQQVIWQSIVSEHSAGRRGPDGPDGAAEDHARVIADCFKHSTVLPFRFGTTFADDDALRRSVRSNQRHFTANVERLRGKAEMHLKVVVDDTCRRDASSAI